MTKIGLVAGTFDPPHLGHLDVAQAALYSGEIDTVWFLPCWIHGFGKKPVDFVHRVNMCQLMIQNKDKIFVCADEGGIKSTSSVEILRFLKNNNKNKDFRLVLGTDNYWTMDLWNDEAEVMKLAKPIWIERPGESRIPEKAYPLYNTTSSTEVRKLISENGDIHSLVHPKVIKYIDQENLYSK